MPLLGNLPDTIDGLLGTATGSASADTGGAVDVSHTLGLDTVVETSPTVALGVSDLVGLSVSAPTAVGVSADVGQLDVGGLLNGLV